MAKRFIAALFTLLFLQKAAPAQTAEEYYQLAKTLHQQGRLVEAIAFYDECLTREPGHAEALYNRAGALFTEGRYEGAARDFQKVASLKKHDAEACERAANALFMQGKFKDAAEWYAKAIAIEPSARARVSRSLALQEAGDLDGAVAEAEKAIDAAPDDPRTWSAKATALFRGGQVEMAVAAWREAAQRVPGDAELLANLGAGLCEMGIWPEALKWLNRSVTLEASAKAYVNRAQCFLESGNLAAAEADIAAADLMEPASADVHNIRGLLFLKKGQPEEAVRSFTNALAWQSNHPNALYNRSQVEYAMGHLAEAVADLDRLINLRPRAARARYARALAHYEMKDFEAACADFRAAQDLGLADVSAEYGVSFCGK